MSVIINGGGIIGLFLARILSKLTNDNLDISVIEQQTPCPYNTALYNKIPNVIALSREAYFELMKVDIDSILLNYSTSINQIEISEYTRFNKVFIKSQDYQLSELGYVVAIDAFKKNLFDFLSKQSRIRIFCPATIQQIQRRKSCNIVILNTGEQISSKLIIAADGSSSQLATYCGIQWCKRNYQQTAVVTEIVTEIPHFGTAFERFTIYGPLALLPMFNNVSCVIWCISNHKRKAVSEWNHNRFIQELQTIFGWKLGKILSVKKRYFYDLWLIYAKKHITHRIALVGNAAQTLHPVAGQGFNLGIRDALVLAKIIYQSLLDNKDIGEYSILELYQKHRRPDQHRTIIATDGLIRIFSNHYLPLVIARNLGLLCVSHSFILKRFLIDTILSYKTY